MKFSETQSPKDDVEAGSIDGTQTLPLGSDEPIETISEPTRCFPEICYRALPIIVCCDEQRHIKQSRTNSKKLLDNERYQLFVLFIIILSTIFLVKFEFSYF